LGNKDPTAPIILFSFGGAWGWSELSERRLNISQEESPQDLLETQKLCTDIAIGLQNNLNQRISFREIINEFFTFITNIRDSSRKIILEVDEFFKAPYVVRRIHISPTKKYVVRFGLVQLNHSLKPIHGQFGCEPKFPDILKGKILSAIRIAIENQVDIITFSELCFKKEWIGSSWQMCQCDKQAGGVDCKMPPYPFRASLPQHADLVTDWCEACGTMWRRKET
jgi:hypothetical protein